MRMQCDARYCLVVGNTGPDIQLTRPHTKWITVSTIAELREGGRKIVSKIVLVKRILSASDYPVLASKIGGGYPESSTSHFASFQSPRTGSGKIADPRSEFKIGGTQKD